MDGRMDGWMDGRMDGWMDGWMDGRMDGWTDGWMDGRMDGWMSLVYLLNIQRQSISLKNYQNKWNRIIKYDFVIPLFNEVCQ